MTNLTEHIGRGPDVCNGRPVFIGARIPVQSIFDHLSAGGLPAEVRSCFPELTDEMIRECFEFAARLTDRQLVPVPRAA